MLTRRALASTLDGNQRENRAVHPLRLVCAQTLERARLRRRFAVLDHAFDLERRRLRPALDGRSHVAVVTQPGKSGKETPRTPFSSWIVEI
jgi:hypothetical protein